MTRLITVAVTATIAALSFAHPSLAQDIPAPTGNVILTISGDIDVTNVDETLQFDRETFAALADSTFETTTTWTEGPHTFHGLSLHTLTELLALTDGSLLATAVNDYTVEIPVSDAQPGGPIIAYQMDGEDMSVREKGPLWIVYPYDSSPDYRTAVIHSRSIWQLDRLTVVK